MTLPTVLAVYIIVPLARETSKRGVSPVLIQSQLFEVIEVLSNVGTCQRTHSFDDILGLVDDGGLKPRS